jgi:rhamnogalacturonan endolyase
MIHHPVPTGQLNNSIALFSKAIARMKKLSTLLLLAGILTRVAAQTPAITEDARTVTLSNGMLSVSFNKSNADLTTITTSKGVSILGKQGRGYLLGPGFSMAPCTYRLVRQTNDLIEIAFNNPAANHFTYDLHYVIRKGIAGVYCFLVQSHNAGDSTGNFGQTRWGIRADESLFDYHLVRDSIQGPMPKMAELKSENEIQDWTFRMADGTVYTKYNYADYIEDRYVHGMAGRTSGLGLFVIQASHEYLNGGPTKQYQNVHSNPYLICMFNCGHFLSDIRKGDEAISDDWVKLQGPFLLYVNTGNSTDAIWKDAKQQATSERSQWPYQWMQNEYYPLQRSTARGRIVLNKKPVQAGVHVILADGSRDWQAQSRGYIYSGLTNEKGEFSIPNIRTGTYTLYAYGNNQTDELRVDKININAANTLLGEIAWETTSKGKLLWQIGEADRRTTGFKYYNHVRTYGLFDSVPAELTYVIGKSKPIQDWYYAQTQKGKWNIVFSIDQPAAGQASLTIAMAGVAKNPLLEVMVNDQKVASLDKLGNDASIYRSAIAGGYYQQHTIRFDAAVLKKGDNTITLSLPNVKSGGGIMYDAIKLELQ